MLPWEMVAALRDSAPGSPLANAYHLNDRAFFYRDGYSDGLVTRATDEASDPLLNPAQIWTPAGRRRDASATRFLRWLVANRVRLASGWFPAGAAAAMRGDGHRSLYSARAEHTFDWVHAEHVKMIRELQRNEHLADDWHWHRPPRRRRPRF